MKTCVVIPAYNEAETIGEIIKSVRRYVPDVLVIDDGSADKTAQIAKEMGASVISYKINRGKGRALYDGFDYALKNNYDAVITMDGDGQHLPGDIMNICDSAIKPKVGIVVGNRMANPEDMPALRFATNLFMSLIISVICRQNIPDTQCGFRLIRCNLLRDMRLISANYEIESEMLIRASRMGFKIVSVPIKSIYQGQVSLINPVLDTWRFCVMLFKVLLF